MTDYLTHVEVAISRGDVEMLVVFWAQSATHREGKVVHDLIKQSIPKLARDNRIKYKGDSFREFVQAYDKVVLDRKCGAPDHCLVYFAQLGHRKGILLALERGADNYGEAIIAALENGRLTIIDDILWPLYDEKKDVYLVRDFMIKAVKTGDLDTVSLFANKSFESADAEFVPSEIELGLRNAVRQKKLEIVTYLIEMVKEMATNDDYKEIFLYTLRELLRIPTSGRIRSYLRDELRKIR